MEAFKACIADLAHGRLMLGEKVLGTLYALCTSERDFLNRVTVNIKDGDPLSTTYLLDGKPMYVIKTSFEDNKIMIELIPALENIAK